MGTTNFWDSLFGWPRGNNAVNFRKILTNYLLSPYFMTIIDEYKCFGIDGGMRWVAQVGGRWLNPCYDHSTAEKPAQFFYCPEFYDNGLRLKAFPKLTGERLSS